MSKYEMYLKEDGVECAKAQLNQEQFNQMNDTICDLINQKIYQIVFNKESVNMNKENIQKGDSIEIVSGPNKTYDKFIGRMTTVQLIKQYPPNIGMGLVYGFKIDGHYVQLEGKHIRKLT